MILLYGYADEMIGERFGENKKSAESEAGRMLLATLLAENGIDATLDNIKRKENGKPYLDGCQGVDFNITHSKGLVACVLSVGEGAVGVDAEPTELAYSKEKQESLAERFFSDDERESLRASKKSFSELWTKREACLKMTGEGFAAGIGKTLNGARCTTFRIDGYTVAVATESSVEIKIKAYNK